MGYFSCLQSLFINWWFQQGPHLGGKIAINPSALLPSCRVVLQWGRAFPVTVPKGMLPRNRSESWHPPSQLNLQVYDTYFRRSTKQHFYQNKCYGIVISNWNEEFNRNAGLKGAHRVYNTASSEDRCPECGHFPPLLYPDRSQWSVLRTLSNVFQELEWFSFERIGKYLLTPSLVLLNTVVRYHLPPAAWWHLYLHQGANPSPWLLGSLLLVLFT